MREYATRLKPTMSCSSCYDLNRMPIQITNLWAFFKYFNGGNVFRQDFLNFLTVLFIKQGIREFKKE